MHSIKVGWKKQAPNEVQFFSNTQRAQHQSLNEIKNQAEKVNKKRVQFNCHPPIADEQAFQNTKDKHSKTRRSHSFISEDNDFTSSSIKLFANETPLINNKPICSVRTTVATFIIVVFIILAAGISVGIMFGIIKSQQNSSGTGTLNNNQNSLSTISAMVMTSSISIGSQSGAPCTSYTTINDPTRNIANTGIYGACDRGSLFNASSDGSWIRFVGSGGTIIPLTSPGENHCGGFVPGWFNGTLPSTVGNVVNGTVCFDINDVSCNVAVDISLVNCGGFYVYLLPSVYLCDSRYCTT